MKNLKAVDFFSGAGGMSCGFAQAGVEILAGIDIEKQFEETYLANHKRIISMSLNGSRMSLKESKASTTKTSTNCFLQTGRNTGLFKNISPTRGGSSEGYECLQFSTLLEIAFSTLPSSAAVAFF